VHEGEVEELRPRHRAQGQLPPERLEALAEAAFRLLALHLEDDAPPATDLAIRELAHELGEAVLAAIAPVEGAHRHAGGLGHLLGAHVAQATQRHERRGLPHGHEVQLFQAPHASYPLPAPPRGAPRWKEHSFHEDRSTPGV
jgi:hypothetical protein